VGNSRGPLQWRRFAAIKELSRVIGEVLAVSARVWSNEMQLRLMRPCLPGRTLFKPALIVALLAALLVALLVVNKAYGRGVVMMARTGIVLDCSRPPAILALIEKMWQRLARNAAAALGPVLALIENVPDRNAAVLTIAMHSYAEPRAISTIRRMSIAVAVLALAIGAANQKQ
jgi:hypothetical protein